MNGAAHPTRNSGDGARNALADLRTALDAALVALPDGDLADLIALLEGLKVRALTRLLAPPPTPVANRDIVSAAELAAELNLPVSWLRSAARNGRLPALHAGKHWRFSRRQVLDALGRAGVRTSRGHPERAEKPRNGEGAAT